MKEPTDIDLRRLWRILSTGDGKIPAVSPGALNVWRDQRTGKFSIITTTEDGERLYLPLLAEGEEYQVVPDAPPEQTVVVDGGTYASDLADLDGGAY